MRKYDFPDVAKVAVRDAYLAPRIRTNHIATIPANLANFARTGHVRAFDLKWKPGKPGMPHCYWDSDVAKVVEGMALALQIQSDAKLEKQLNSIVRRIVSAQQPDGYLNTHFTVVEPENRWKSLGRMHELYCAGHLMEAAVEHFRATGRREFLDAMCRYADYIAKVFGRGKNQKRGYPGHEEIELALCKLADVSGNKKYLKLAKYFIDERGREPNYFTQEGTEEPNLESRQAHKPVREQTEAEGHTVRAGYLYAGMADVAAATDDAELLAACKRLFDSLAGRRMYITGGIGSFADQERLGMDYYLPNDTAYAESCASIALVFFASRMLNITGDGKYAEAVERALYNGILSGIGLDGTEFFYQNVLEANEQSVPRPELRFAPVRQSWFSCSCCPTNFCRFLPQIGRYVWSVSADTVRLNIPAAGEYLAEGRHVRVTGNYPYDGAVRIEFPEGGKFAFALRIPEWCGKWAVKKNGKNLNGKPSAGYLACGKVWRAGDVLEVDFDMPVRVVYANAHMRNNAGRIALQRGPLVYALESVDNGDMLADLLLPADPKAYKLAKVKGLPAGTVALKAPALREVRSDDALYSDRAPAVRKCTATAIPYALWENRGKSEMLVWVRKI